MCVSTLRKNGHFYLVLTIFLQATWYCEEMWIFGGVPIVRKGLTYETNRLLDQPLCPKSTHCACREENQL
ncbi:hypothetical protein NSMM_150063 [Nitrosomonas mobilis]|uniref:Uncharacterized protein n=1 Tax=Nitrosomonas mobilis TaxID=51642 RepID=A0A1G5SAV0_9PROT|nr:hypothetical protein NSMM_150063 [Nitrosomonas mobilis]